MLLLLMLQGVIIITSDLQSFCCRKFSDIQFLISAKQDIEHDTSVVPDFMGTFRCVSSV